MTQKKEQKFEEAFQELEGIVDKLESGEIALEESLSLYEKGMTLVKLCTGKLDDAELRLEKLANDTENGFRIESVD